jgi:uncharacterized protein
MKNRFVWHDVLSTDVKAAIAFYGEVIGWTTQPFEGSSDGAYTLLVSGQGPLGGVMQLSDDDIESRGMRPHWMGHVEVEDLDATVARVEALGGSIHVPPTSIPDVGRFSVVADPSNATLSVFEPNTSEPPHTSGHGEVGWAELHSDDPDAAFEFYRALFGWARQQELDMGPAGKYAIFGLGDVSLGGIMKRSPQESDPSGWMYYVEVEDLDAAIERAKAAGGTVLYGPTPIPGGRMAQLADPQGSLFGLSGT